jgi:nucleoside-diphosphate-sugar epimerase
MLGRTIMPGALAKQDLEHVLERTADLWPALRGERIFVTGGTGFVGSWLLETFVFCNQRLALGAHALVLSRDPEAFARKAPHLGSDPALSFQRGHAHDFALPSGHFGAVVHAATEQQDPKVDPIELFDRDVNATRRTLELAQRAGAARHLFTSSGAVYGRQPPELSQLAEDDRGAPNAVDVAALYGHSKRASELMCASYAKARGVRSSVARLFAFIGPHLPLDAHYAAGNFVRDAMAGGPIHIGGDGTPLRSYLYAADLALWLWTILLRGEPGRSYNVGSGHALSISELAETVAAAVQPTARVVRAREPVAGVLPARYVPDVSRARSELGLEVNISLRDALERTIAWHRG